MSQIKKLAGQTAVYGISSIVGRIINFLLVPLYTYVLDPENYGLLIFMYSFVAVINVFMIYGMETAYFRYATLTDKSKVFNTSFLSIFSTSILFLGIGFYFSSDIASFLLSSNSSNYVQWFVLIMAFDALAAIPFAKLRADNKAFRFALIKFINIGINLGFNLFFVLLCPYVVNNYSDGFLYTLVDTVFNPELNLVSYVFISNLIASTITLVLLFPEIFQIKFKFDWILWKQMIKYAYPILLIGFAFAMNEMFGRILMKYLLPEQIALHEIGIYSASYKLAILLSLFVQAFRYAAEPFFFAQHKLSASREIYAQVMKFFVVVVTLASLVILLYVDVIKLILGSEFRGAINLLPILLLAYIFIGIFYNLSVWYKLTNKTLYGAIIALTGTVITVSMNYILIPLYGYWGSAWATLSCFFVMMTISFLWGQKHFNVNYDVKRIASYIFLAAFLFFISTKLNIGNFVLKMLVHTVLIGVFLLAFYFIDKKEIKQAFRK